MSGIQNVSRRGWIFIIIPNTNYTLRIKEQATRLAPLFEHDDDDIPNILHMR